jgi:D-alanyl-D-alanine carboxypeptidase
MHIPSIRYGRRVTQNFNKLIGRYPGADGFKTGFICASGYNLVASATRNGKRLIAVVLGASSGQARAVRAAQLLERGFGGNGLGWLKPALGTVDNLVPIDATPPNLRDEMCNGKRKRPATDEDADVVAANGSASTGETSVTFFTAGLQPPMGKPSDLLAAEAAASEPIPVYTGPTKTGPALIAAVAAEAEKQTPAKRGKKSKIAAKKPDAAAPKAEAGAKPAKPAAVRHANARPEATAKPAASAEKKPAASADRKPAAKPVAAADKPAPKPAKPKAAAKPKGENKPAG